MQAEAADRDVNRREQPESPDNGRLDPDFLMSFANGGLLERLAGIDDAPRKGNLAFVTPEPVGANGQDDVCLILAGKDQDEARSVANCRRIKPVVGPSPLRFRYDKLVGCSPRKRASQTCVESRTAVS